MALFQLRNGSIQYRADFVYVQSHQILANFDRHGPAAGSIPFGDGLSVADASLSVDQAACPGSDCGFAAI
jgi:hypothetical protein